MGFTQYYMELHIQIPFGLDHHHTDPAEVHVEIFNRQLFYIIPHTRVQLTTNARIRI